MKQTLFSEHDKNPSGPDVPLAERLRPRSLEEIVGQQHLIGPGKVLRMRGKGVPHLRSDRRGDQLVVLNVEIPKRLKGEQRELFEQLAESLGSEVHPQERSFLDSLRDFFGG